MKRLLAGVFALVTIGSFSHKIQELAYKKGYEDAREKYLSMVESEKHFTEEHYIDLIEKKDVKIAELEQYRLKELQEENNKKSNIKVFDNIPNTNFKAWMPHRLLTLKSSMQYKLQQSAWTNNRGYRIYDDRYMVAVGTAFGKPGDKLKIKMSTGDEFNAIIGDQKANKDTDDTNRQCIHNGSIIEFIVDDKVFKQTSNKFSEFEGSVVEIQNEGGY